MECFIKGSVSLILLQEVKDQSSSVLEGEEIRWVITVPAVWRQPAKQFMREAAYVVRTHTQPDEYIHLYVRYEWQEEATNLQLTLY